MRFAFKSDKEVLWEKLEGSISLRRWDATQAAWINFGIPTIDPPGSAPETTLAGFFEEIELFSDVALDEIQNTPIMVSRGSVPDLVFREAVYWLHKSIHVLGASESHVDLGMPTWSLSAAYQSGFFAARSIMAFLGFAVGEVQGVSVVVDLCRNLHGLSPRKVAELGAFEEELSLRSLGFLFGHVHIWRLFQRLLRVVTRVPWPTGWTTFFHHLEIADLTKQRHSLHYHLGFWVMNDMHESVHSEAFGNVSFTGEARELFDSNDDNFSLAAAFTLSRMALSLFQSFGSVTNRLASEQALLSGVCHQDRHPLFSEALLSPLVKS